MIDRELLARCAADYAVEVTAPLAERLDIYARLLVAGNETMNLTAITDPAGIVVKHFVDSLTAARDLPDGAFSLIDVGTGAGFPGVPLALLREDCRLTLLDSLQKRLTFLDGVCAELGLAVTLVHARAEDAGQDARYRERFDVATARAVAAFPTVCEYCLPFVRVGGRLVALRGKDDADAAGARAATQLGGGTLSHRALTLPATPVAGFEPMERTVVTVTKTAATPKLYPRPAAKIAKRPL